MRERVLHRMAIMIAVALGVVVMFALTPVGAHVGGNVGHLWRQHIRPKADARYLPGVVRYVEGAELAIGASSDKIFVAACPDGWHAVGGGLKGNGFLKLTQSYPSNGGTTSLGTTGWATDVRNDGGNTTARAFAVCVKVQNARANFEPGDF